MKNVTTKKLGDLDEVSIHSVRLEWRHSEHTGHEAIAICDNVRGRGEDGEESDDMGAEMDRRLQMYLDGQFDLVMPVVIVTVHFGSYTFGTREAVFTSGYSGMPAISDDPADLNDKAGYALEDVQEMLRSIGILGENEELDIPLDPADPNSDPEKPVRLTVVDGLKSRLDETQAFEMLAGRLTEAERREYRDQEEARGRVREKVDDWNRTQSAAMRG